MIKSLGAALQRAVQFVDGKVMRTQLLVRLSITCALTSVFLMSAIAVIYSSHQSRELTAERSRLDARIDDLQLEWAQLLIEQSALSAPNLVESAARDMNMSVPAGHQIEVKR